MDAADHDLAAHVGKALAHPLVVAHLAGAVVHVEHGARLQLRAAQQTAELFRRDPERRRQSRRTAKDVVVVQQGVNIKSMSALKETVLCWIVPEMLYLQLKR